MSPLITLVLPWPPSANSYVRHVGGGRHYLTKTANRFREQVSAIVAQAGVNALPGRLEIFARVHPPTKRRVDIDNRIKALCDALQHAGCYDDDEAIDKLTIERGEIIKGGQCRVLIMCMGNSVPSVPMAIEDVPFG